MPAGFSLTVEELVEIMLSNVGQRGSEDLKLHWFETTYSLIREQPWPWNWKETRFNTLAPITTVETYTWALGSKILQASGPLTITEDQTGRAIELDERRYFVTYVDVAANQVHVDAPLPYAEATGVTLTFHRIEYAIRTNSIFNVDVDGSKVASSTKNYWRKFRGRRWIGYSGGQPYEYEVVEHHSIPAPLYRPNISGVPAAGNIAIGKYLYFWTVKDTESGLESPPGPIYEYEVTGAAATISLQYNNPSGNIHESSTRKLRLWRSLVGAVGKRFPAYLVGEKAAGDVADFVSDNFSDTMLIKNERYYNGHQLIVHFPRWPDATYSVDVTHVDCYGGRPGLDDMIYTGRNNIVTELLPVGASTFVELSNRDVAGNHAAIRKFRTHLAYLVRNTHDGNDADPGLEEIRINDGIPDDYSDDPVSSSYLDDPVSSYSWKS